MIEYALATDRDIWYHEQYLLRKNNKTACSVCLRTRIILDDWCDWCKLVVCDLCCDFVNYNTSYPTKFLCLKCMKSGL